MSELRDLKTQLGDALDRIATGLERIELMPDSSAIVRVTPPASGAYSLQSDAIKSASAQTVRASLDADMALADQLVSQIRALLANV